MTTERERIAPDGGRYDRQQLITWWEQAKVAQARILVVGAGALGNEVLKLLALMGVGHTLVYDLDRIEESNLSRAVLFRAGDEGGLKAEVAARRMRELNADVQVEARGLDITATAGLGLFAWADVVIGAVDNREARVFINACCAATGRVWIDGAIESLSGVVRGFDPARGSCYECTMSAVDRKILAERRSCAMLARRAVARGHVPTTAVAASIVAAMQVQEALKHLHGQPVLLGEGLQIDGLLAEVSRIAYPRREDCPGHDPLGPLQSLGAGAGDVTVGELLDRAEARLGAGASIDLSRDVVYALECAACQSVAPIGAALGAVREGDAACPDCGEHRLVHFTSSLTRDSVAELGIGLNRTLAELGVPAFDVVVARQGLGRREAWLLDADAGAALQGLASSWVGLKASAAAIGGGPAGPSGESEAEHRRTGEIRAT